MTEAGTAAASGAPRAGSGRSRGWLEGGTLDPNFWLGDIDARLVGIFRAGLGAILFIDTLSSLPLVTHLYGTDGLWPSALGHGLLVGVSNGTLWLVWAVGALALLSFSLGVFAQASAALSWLFLASVHQRNLGVTTGGDFLAQILLFFCIFFDTGAAFSLGARWFGKGRAFLPAAPFRAMQTHVAILYFVTARLKVRGGWLSGDGIYLSLQHFGFLRPPGAFLLEHPELCRLSTYIVLGLEGAFAFFALSPVNGPRARLCALGCALSVQLGILATMRVGMFTALMLWICVLYLPARTQPMPSTPPSQWRRLLLLGTMAALVVLLCWGAFVGRRFPLPRALDAGLHELGLVQPFDLFGCTYEVARWQAEATTVGGERVDLLNHSARGFRSEVGWIFSPLYKITFANDADYAHIARWLCREETRATGRQLSRVHLLKRANEPHAPGAPALVHDTTLYEGPCR